VHWIVGLILYDAQSGVREENPREQGKQHRSSAGNAETNSYPIEEVEEAEYVDDRDQYGQRVPTGEASQVRQNKRIDEKMPPLITSLLQNSEET